MSITNWDVIFQVVGTQNVREFVAGTISGKGLYRKASNTDAGGAVRTLLRSGTERARDLARKALSRRS